MITTVKTMPKVIADKYDVGFRDGGNGTIRVWRRGWSGDSFEVMTKADFIVLKDSLNKLSFMVVDFDLYED